MRHARDSHSKAGEMEIASSGPLIFGPGVAPVATLHGVVLLWRGDDSHDDASPKRGLEKPTARSRMSFRTDLGKSSPFHLALHDHDNGLESDPTFQRVFG